MRLTHQWQVILMYRVIHYIDILKESQLNNPNTRLQN